MLAYLPFTFGRVLTKFVLGSAKRSSVNDASGRRLRMLYIILTSWAEHQHLTEDECEHAEGKRRRHYDLVTIHDRPYAISRPGEGIM